MDVDVINRIVIIILVNNYYVLNAIKMIINQDSYCGICTYLFTMLISIFSGSQLKHT